MVGWAVSGRFRFLLLLFRGEGGPLEKEGRKEGQFQIVGGRDQRRERKRPKSLSPSSSSSSFLSLPPHP